MTQTLTTIHPFTPPANAEVLTLWAGWQRAGALSERTIAERLSAMRSMCDEYQVRPLEVTTAHIVTFLSRREISDATRSTYATHLRAFFRWALLQNLITVNPMDRVPAPKRPRYMPRPIHSAQLTRLLEVCNRQRTRTMVLLAAFAGLRVHEIAKFRGSDLDPERWTLRVTGKGLKPAILPAHALILEAAATMPTDGHWFPSSAHSGPVAARSVSQSIGRAMNRAGIDGTAHQLRHWYGTELLNAGTDLRTVQELMRHDQITSTQIYTQVSDASKVTAMAALHLD